MLLAGHLSNVLADWLQDTTAVHCDAELVIEPTKLGTAGALRNARAKLKTEHVLVCNGDTLTTAPFTEFIRQAKGYKSAELHARRYGNEHMFHTGFTLYDSEALTDLVLSCEESDLTQWNRWRTTKLGMPGQYLDLGDPRQYKRAQRIFPKWQPLS